MAVQGRCWKVLTITAAATGGRGLLAARRVSSSNSENAEAVSNFYLDPKTGEKRTGNNWNYGVELSALAVRLGHTLHEVPSLSSALDQMSRSYSMRVPSRLSMLGRSSMIHYLNEYLYFSYPAMDGSMLIDLSTAVTNGTALAKLSDHLGITDLIRTELNLTSPLHQQLISQTFCAVVGAIYQDKGPPSAKKLVHDFVVPQLADKDLEEIIKFQHPRFMLNLILTSSGQPKAISRLMTESGRATHFPSFVVGIFSGDNCLGEGTGTSLQRAEQEALHSALRSHFQKEVSAAALPSQQEDFCSEAELKQKVLSPQSATR